MILSEVIKLNKLLLQNKENSCLKIQKLHILIKNSILRLIDNGVMIVDMNSVQKIVFTGYTNKI